MKALDWLLRIAAAAILLQTLFFKFTGAPESVQIFTDLGVEPWGRWASGVAELIAAVLLLVPRTVAVGAALGAGIMVGAVGSHLTVLGVAIPNDGGDDGGTLFALAVVVLVCCLFSLWRHRKELPVVGEKL